jgi:hypothetical protein
MAGHVPVLGANRLLHELTRAQLGEWVLTTGWVVTSAHGQKSQARARQQDCCFATSHPGNTDTVVPGRLMTGNHNRTSLTKPSQLTQTLAFASF